jgi:hypothetical protein
MLPKTFCSCDYLGNPKPDLQKLMPEIAFYLAFICMCIGTYRDIYFMYFSFTRGCKTRRQFYDFGIYSYNSSAIVGYSVFQSRRKYFY